VPLDLSHWQAADLRWLSLSGNALRTFRRPSASGFKPFRRGSADPGLAGNRPGRAQLFSQDARHQLRACLAPGCVVYFIKNHPRREWCSAGCGNRARSARHYQRHRRTAI
jgi:predicted RNA-binding Zn ribbon-like protein